MRRIIGASGRDLGIEHDPKGPTIKTSFALDSRRARDALGWELEVSLDDGVRSTVAWWRKVIEAAG